MEGKKTGEKPGTRLEDEVKRGEEDGGTGKGKQFRRIRESFDEGKTCSASSSEEEEEEFESGKSVEEVVAVPGGRDMTFKRITELCLDKDDLENMNNTDHIAEKLLYTKVARLDWQGFTRIANLEALTNIEDLYLQYNRIRKIDNLDFLHKLRFLALSNNSIEKIENIAHLTRLEFLDVSNNQIQHLNTAELPTSIRIFDCRGNPFCSLQGEYESELLQALPNLKRLNDNNANGKSQQQQAPETDDEVSYNCLVRTRSSSSSSFRLKRRGSSNSSQLMHEAILKLDEMCITASMKGKELSEGKRREFSRRSKQRIAEQGKLFAQRTPLTLFNTSSSTPFRVSKAEAQPSKECKD